MNVTDFKDASQIKTRRTVQLLSAADPLSAVDPGVQGSALAHFESSLLVSVATGVLPSKSTRLVIEKPTIYPGDRRTDPNDLIDLAVVVGRWLQLAEQSITVLPRVWKGTTPKPISHRRIWRTLDAHERDAVARCVGMSTHAIDRKIEAACLRLASTGKVTGYSWEAHNALDAVGIGLFELGRYYNEY